MTKQNAGVIKRAIVTPDKHFPLHDDAAINVCCRAIEVLTSMQEESKKDKK